MKRAGIESVFSKTSTSKTVNIYHNAMHPSSARLRACSHALLPTSVSTVVAPPASGVLSQVLTTSVVLASNEHVWPEV